MIETMHFWFRYKGKQISMFEIVSNHTHIRQHLVWINIMYGMYRDFLFGCTVSHFGMFLKFLFRKVLSYVYALFFIYCWNEWRHLSSAWSDFEWKKCVYNPNLTAGLVGKVRKEQSPEGGRKGGWRKKARAAGPGLEPGTYRVLGEGPQLHAMGAV